MSIIPYYQAVRFRLILSWIGCIGALWLALLWGAGSVHQRPVPEHHPVAAGGSTVVAYVSGEQRFSARRGSANFSSADDARQPPVILSSWILAAVAIAFALVAIHYRIFSALVPVACLRLTTLNISCAPPLTPPLAI